MRHVKGGGGGRDVKGMRTEERQKRKGLRYREDKKKEERDEK